MNFINHDDYGLLKKLISFKQNETKEFVSEYINSKYSIVIETPEYILAEGNIPVALTAHLDTYFEKDNFKRDTLFHYMHEKLMWAPNGAGFDDKAGVFSILKIIEDGYFPHVIFCCDEEIGSLGALQLIEDISKSPFDELKYIIGLDRANDNDCVFYDCSNEDFIRYVESFGFNEAFGTSSDVAHISMLWNVAGVNLSVGYKNQHTGDETLNYNSMYRTIDKVKSMLEDEGNIKTFKH